MKRLGFTSGGSKSFRKVGRIATLGEGTYPSRHKDAVPCPVCHSPAGVLTSGHLRRHRDPFGHTCFNKRPPS